MKSLAKFYFLGLLFFLLGPVSLFAFPKSAYATTLTCSISSNLVGSSINVGDSFTVTLSRSGWVHSATGYKHGMYIYENGAYEVQNPYSSPTDGTPHGDWSATYSDGSSTTWSNTFTATRGGTITIAGVAKEDYEGSADNPPGVSCGAQLPGWITINQPPLADPTINCPINGANLKTYMYTALGNPQEPPGYSCGYPAVFDVQGVDHNNPAVYTGIQDNYGIFGTPNFSPAAQGWLPLSKSGTNTVIPSWLVPPTYTGPIINGTYTWGVQVKGTRISDGATVYSNKTYATFNVQNPPDGIDPIFISYTLTPGCNANGTPYVDVFWNPRAQNDDSGYTISREISDGTGLVSPLTPDKQPWQTYRDSSASLVSGQTYRYKVEAYNPYGLYAYVWSQSVTTNYCNGATYQPLISTSPPPTMTVNQALPTFPAGIVMKNTGTRIWTTSISDDPAGFWKLEETGPFTSEVTPAADSSGNGNTGTYFSYGSPTSVPGKVGKAINFDGDDYIHIPDNNFLRPAKITVAAWVKSNTPTWNDYGWIVSNRTTTDGNGYMLHPWQNSQTILFEVGIGGTWQSVAYTPSAPSDITKWHHYVGTYDGATLRLYVDGSQVTSLLVSGNITYNGTSNYVTIGKDDLDVYSSGTRLGKGQIDEVIIYNRAISAGDVYNLYIGSVAFASTPHKLGYLPDINIWGSTRVSLPQEPIIPGSIALFGYDGLRAPATPGTYYFRWGMLEEGNQWFGDTSPNWQVNVYNPVTVGSCSANPTATNTNTNVTFSANNVSGGTGSYNYSWTGDVTGTTQSVTKVGGYPSAGTKNATVTVTSGTLAPATASCSAVVDDSPPLPPTSSVGVQVGAESACYTSSSWLTKNPFTITASDPQSGISKVTYKLQRNSTGLCYTGVNGSSSFTVNCATSPADIVIYTAPGPYPLTPLSVSKQVDIQFTTIDVPPPDNEYTLTATAYNGDLPTPLSATSSPPYRLKTSASCGVPYLKTTGGDIHSNININIPNPSTTP